MRGTVLLAAVALSIASMIAFITSCSVDREGACDHWTLLAGDLLMYLALAQTVAGFFSPYLRMLEIMSMSLSMEIEREAISLIWIGLVIAGSTAWILSTYVGPVVSFIRSPLGRVMKLLHALGYIGLMVCISQLWLVALRFEERTPTEYGSLLPWLSTFATPHVLVRRLMAEIGVAQQSNI